MDTLHRYLEDLIAGTDARARLAADPIVFAHRYTDRRDVEVAGLIAAGLAYGRVSLFLPVLGDVFAALDAQGGPHAAVVQTTAATRAALEPLVYRWNRGRDLVWLLGGLRRVLGHDGHVEDLFAGTGDLAARLTRAVDTLRDAVLAEARDDGADATSFEDLPRGIRYLLPSPRQGSACKRWNLYLRWMVRPADDGVDLGLWTTLAPGDLVMPVDVHVSRIAGLVGLTARQDASWRTAIEITERLRAFDPHDPLRFDFALAHLGISQACRGVRDDAVCPQCPLLGACAVGSMAPTRPVREGTRRRPAAPRRSRR
ncbi:MAG: TIGR02757 family protein [Alphaproteobacteria bacterium]|nr:TIGR02757 family protein [Alphaproteobacteria bacterium]